METTYIISYKLYLKSLMHFVAIAATGFAVVYVKAFRKLSMFYNGFSQLLQNVVMIFHVT